MNSDVRSSHNRTKTVLRQRTRVRPRLSRDVWRSGRAHLAILRRPHRGGIGRDSKNRAAPRILGLPAKSGVLNSQCLAFDLEFDLHIRGRNCNRTVKRSPALKRLDKLTALLARNAFHQKVQAHGVEDCDIGAHRLGAIKHTLNIDRDSAKRDVF